ncbi:MAG: DUF1918 domain-containing protein [Acidimicrobiales bacterium]
MTIEANVGDVIVVESMHIGEPNRRCVVREVLGEGEHRHYAVEWDDGHQSVFFPGSSSIVEHHPAPGAAAPQQGGA